MIMKVAYSPQNMHTDTHSRQDTQITTSYLQQFVYYQKVIHLIELLGVWIAFVVLLGKTKVPQELGVHLNNKKRERKREREY